MEQTDNNALIQIGKTMRAELRSALSLRDAGNDVAAKDVCDRIVQSTPKALWNERWYDTALGLSSLFPTILETNPRKRIYIVGCGRSGTWFGLGMFATFADTYVSPIECHFGYFGRVAENPQSVHVAKRTHDAHRYFADLPANIAIVYLLRDPRDVLTSSHLEKENYISFDRWTNEINSFKKLLHSGRPNVIVVRIEDLATQAGRVQKNLARQLGLQIEFPANQFFEVFQPDAQTQAIMQTLRPPDPGAVGRWRRHPGQVEYIRSLSREINAQFSSLAQQFHYDLTS